MENGEETNVAKIYIEIFGRRNVRSSYEMIIYQQRDYINHKWNERDFYQRRSHQTLSYYRETCHEKVYQKAKKNIKFEYIQKKDIIRS